MQNKKIYLYLQINYKLSVRLVGVGVGIVSIGISSYSPSTAGRTSISLVSDDKVLTIVLHGFSCYDLS